MSEKQESTAGPSKEEQIAALQAQLDALKASLKEEKGENTPAREASPTSRPGPQSGPAPVNVRQAADDEALAKRLQQEELDNADLSTAGTSSTYHIFTGVVEEAPAEAITTTMTMQAFCGRCRTINTVPGSCREFQCGVCSSLNINPIASMYPRQTSHQPPPRTNYSYRAAPPPAPRPAPQPQPVAHRAGPPPTPPLRQGSRAPAEEWRHSNTPGRMPAVCGACRHVAHLPPQVRVFRCSHCGYDNEMVEGPEDDWCTIQ